MSEISVTFITCQNAQMIDTTDNRAAIAVPPIDQYLAVYGVDSVKELSTGQINGIRRAIVSDVNLEDNLTEELREYIADEDLIVDLTDDDYDALKAGVHDEAIREVVKEAIVDFAAVFAAGGKDYDDDELYLYFEASFD